ncbi:MAG: hypothetical protein MJ215_06930 [Spirochaetia bacterium]|nr:hypothetical protein [Spirochaetia bacterium]
MENNKVKNDKIDMLESSVLDIIDNEPDTVAAPDQQPENFANLEDDFGNIADNDFAEAETPKKNEDFSKLAESTEYPADIDNA